MVPKDVSKEGECAALVEETVSFKQLGLAIVDEQHRFGVRQRATFREKGVDPHLLLTTAPRHAKRIARGAFDQCPVGCLHVSLTP